MRGASKSQAPAGVTLYGMKVIVSPLMRPVPVLKTSLSFKWCTPAVRAKHDAWLLERFGTRDPGLRMLDDDTIVMSLEMFERLKTAMR